MKTNTMSIKWFVECPPLKLSYSYYQKANSCDELSPFIYTQIQANSSYAMNLIDIYITERNVILINSLVVIKFSLSLFITNNSAIA